MKVHYGVRALFDIAYFSDGKPALIKDISRRQKIPHKYLEQIFHKLKKAQILIGKRGPSGGYVLARRPEEITLGDVIRATEGPTHLVACAGTGGRKCTMTDRCASSQMWTELDEKINSFFEGITIKDLCERGNLLGLTRE
jgi:Rrf2 family iron-sulfur cluster assembly transcriptional regulator